MNTPDDFDARAREAGRALRQAPPADGLVRIERARRNRRIAQAGGAFAVAALAVGAVVALVSRGDDDTIVTTDPSTVAPTVPTTAVPTLPTTAPGRVPPSTAPVVVPPSDPAPSTTPPSSVPGHQWPPTVWVGDKLAGWYDGATFVPFEFGEHPDGLVGATLDVVDTAGGSHTVTVADADCSSPYLTPSVGRWDVLAGGAAPIGAVPFQLGDNPPPVAAALTAAGADPVASRGVAVPVPAGTTPLWVVLVDGWNDTYQYPTWIAVWDGTSLRTVEGDPDPSQALDLGRPVDAFVDLDRDGDAEIVFAAGDGWGIHEVGSGDVLIFGDGHPCPEGFPGLGVTAADLAGTWGLEAGGEPDVLIEALWDDTQLRYGQWCQGSVVGADGAFSVATFTDCTLGDADQRLTGLAGAHLEVVDAGTLTVVPPDAPAFELYRLADPTGLDLVHGSIAGVRAGAVGDVDELIARLTPELGPPALDTGWFTTPPNPDPEEPDCLANMATRTLWWGDLAVSFWPYEHLDGGVGELWDVTLGAQTDELRLPAGMRYTPVASGIVANQGIGRDTPVGEVPAGVDWSLEADGSGWGLYGARPTIFSGNNVTLTTDGDVVTAVSVTRSFC